MISSSDASAASRMAPNGGRLNIMEEFQLEAQKRMADLSLPTSRDERWRFADLKRAKLSQLDEARDLEVEIEGLADGVALLSLEEALDRDEELIRGLLQRLQGELGADYFMAQAQASGRINGTCLWVEKGTDLRDPIVLNRRCLAEEGTRSAVTLLVVEENASISVLERLKADSGATGNFLGSSGVLLQSGSQASYVFSQELPEDFHFVHCSHVELGRDSDGQMVLCNLGASWVRQESTLQLSEVGGSGKLLGLNLLHGNDHVDQHTRQQHLVGNGRSDLLFKNALYDQSRAIFGGLIQVEDGAHHTDSFQSCRNLMLSDEAEANAMPGLEINADQVRCSHGATSGQIDREELFYLQARGIGEDAAKRIITLGFAQEVLDELRSPDVRETLEGLVADRLRRCVSPGI